MRIHGTKILVSTFLLIAAVNLGGCGGGSVTQADPVPGDVDRVSMEALYGSSDTGITLSQNGPLARVEFAGVTPAGKFVALTLPGDSGFEPVQWYWVYPESGSADLVHLAVPTEGGLEVGVVAPESAAGASVTLWIELAERLGGGEPPSEELAAAAEELAVVTLSDEKINLSWTQMLPGDFNFDGIVNTTDLVPLANNLGATIDREMSTARQQTVYWLDYDQDGEVTCDDSQVIAGSFKRELAGFVIKQNGAQVPGEGSDELSVTVEEAVTFEGLPPRYSVELLGSAEEQWSVAAVDIDGTYGEEIEISGEQTALIATVDIVGIDLIDLPPILPDGNVGYGKSTLRVIEPIDIVDRMPISLPALQEANRFFFTQVPRDRRVLLDCVYQPAFDLATGNQVPIDWLEDESTPQSAKLTMTAVPVTVPEGEGITDVFIEILIEENPWGGYFVEINAITTVPGRLPDFYHALLSYQDGRLKRDADNDNDFADELGFADADRDGVSDFWIEEELAMASGDPYVDELIIVQGTVQSIDPAAGTIVLTGVTGISSDYPFGSGPLSLGINEDTLVMSQVWGGNVPPTPLDSTTLQPGSLVEVAYHHYRDTNDGTDSMWVESIIVLSDAEV